MPLHLVSSKHDLRPDDRIELHHEDWPYVLPDSGLVIQLPTKHNDYGFPVESAGFPVDVPLADDVAAEEVASEFESFV